MIDKISNLDKQQYANIANFFTAWLEKHPFAEMDDDTGDMIYVEYRLPINRASDQTEDVKLVVEF